MSDPDRKEEAKGTSNREKPLLYTTRTSYIRARSRSRSGDRHHRRKEETEKKRLSTPPPTKKQSSSTSSSGKILERSRSKYEDETNFEPDYEKDDSDY